MAQQVPVLNVSFFNPTTGAGGTFLTRDRDDAERFAAARHAEGAEVDPIRPDVWTPASHPSYFFD